MSLFCLDQDCNSRICVKYFREILNRNLPQTIIKYSEQLANQFKFNDNIIKSVNNTAFLSEHHFNLKTKLTIYDNSCFNTGQYFLNNDLVMANTMTDNVCCQ